MEMDEAGTLTALKALHTDVVRPLAAKCQGRIFKVMGDGVLAEFGAINAVQCAVELQAAMAAPNPQTRSIGVRTNLFIVRWSAAIRMLLHRTDEGIVTPVFYALGLIRHLNRRERGLIDSYCHG
jgi:hypothetical protein